VLQDAVGCVRTNGSLAVLECLVMDASELTRPKETKKPNGPAGPHASPVLHRVCIQCNNMFRVPPDKFDAKQCPNCHKG
jgi:hypothetical protein